MKTLRIAAALILATTLFITGCSEDSSLATAPDNAPTDAAKKKNELVGDRQKGNTLAKKCVECHGMDGNAAKQGGPFIAGLDQQYLIRSMLAYSNGARKHEKMKTIIESMEPAEIADVSAYYASLKTPWRGGAIIQPTPLAYNRMAVSRGKAAAESCDSCHGHEQRISKTNVPSLSGMQPRYFISSLKSYYNGQRSDRIMELLQYKLKDSSFNDLAAYYAAQTPQQPPPPKHGDVRRGAKLARHCAGCHGNDGNSPNPAVPSLTGHHQDYLYKATTDYRTGKRKHKVMQDAVKKLDDRDIHDLSAHYAKQLPDNLLFYSGTAGKRFDPVGDGARIASACNGCHGDKGNSVSSNTPSLTGLHVNYLARASAAYRDGTRTHAAMKTMVDYLDDIGMEKVGFYYALQEPRSRKQRIHGNAEKGRELSGACAGCHGKNGVTHDPLVPSLAGQDFRYLMRATIDYRSGKRPHEGMQGAVEKLIDAEVRDLATFYAQQVPEKPTGVYIPEPPQKLIEQKCVLCHGKLGFSNEFDKPRLAGQSETYLISAMQQYADGRRKHSAMQAMADVLSLIEIKGIAAFYARQKK